MGVQFIKTDAGEELAVITRRDYEALLARAGDPAAEDAMTARIVAETGREIAEGVDASVPSEVWEQMELEGALRSLRKWRGLKQAELAFRSGVAQPYISAIEFGSKSASLRVREKLAQVLRVTPDHLEPHERDIGDLAVMLQVVADDLKREKSEGGLTRAKLSRLQHALQDIRATAGGVDDDHPLKALLAETEHAGAQAFNHPSVATFDALAETARRLEASAEASPPVA